MARLRPLLALLALPLARGAITVYQAPGQAAFATGSAAAAASAYTGAAAYNPTTLVAPPVPTPAVPSSFQIQLNNGGTPGVSIMSVSNQVLGKNATHIQVPFLNLMANIQQRAGSVRVRVGGNSQESATLVPASSIPDGKILQKNLTGVTGTTQTPPLEYSDELFYMMSNISSLVNVNWFLGIPWFVTQPFDLAIVGAAERILGGRVIGYQASNEPDLYNAHGHRPATYGPFDYFGEFSDFLTQLAASGLDPAGRVKGLMLGPSVADATWTPEMVWNTNFVDVYSANLAWLSVEKYPTDNCAAAFNTGAPIIDPQTVFPDFLNHTAHTSLLAPYLNSTAFAQSKGKKLLMFETNTVHGALNFSGAMFHVGGQNVFYNVRPYPSPPRRPTNRPSIQWTVGPAIGPSNQTQILDCRRTGTTSSRPRMGLREWNPVRVGLFNYVTDPSGASDVTAVISIDGGNTTPTQVKVKYLTATSVAQKGAIRGRGRCTFGGNFESDGRLQGTEDVQTVPAPGFALVFLSDSAQTETSGAPSVTFATTALQRRIILVPTIATSVLATSNGHGGKDDPLNFQNELGSTSRGSKKSGALPGDWGDAGGPGARAMSMRWSCS
ncbi:glycoside hydrolase family 79 protein [Mycena leptocephala]|nr:glycoside hydrolase family 79 protein [Mycena leptocephala]